MFPAIFQAQINPRSLFKATVCFIWQPVIAAPRRESERKEVGKSDRNATWKTHQHAWTVVPVSSLFLLSKCPKNNQLMQFLKHVIWAIRCFSNEESVCSRASQGMRRQAVICFWLHSNNHKYALVFNKHMMQKSFFCMTAFICTEKITQEKVFQECLCEIH